MSARPVWLIGCGNMAGAMLQGWLLAGEDASRFTVIDPADPQLPDGIRPADGPPAEGFDDAIVQLGFKPQMLGDIAPSIEPAIGPETVVTSILAGAEIATLRAAFPRAAAVARTMPNLPVANGLGAIGLFVEPGKDAIADELAAWLAPLGHVESVTNDAEIDIVTVLSGSGPAFLYRFAEALGDAGASAGLDPAQSLRLALATVRGAAELAATADESLAQLAERVASPGGTTRAGLDVLDDDEVLKSLIEKTISAAKRRAEEMAQEAR